MLRIFNSNLVHDDRRAVKQVTKGDRIEILGLGSDALNCKPPRQGRNPKTGTKVMVLSKYIPHFNARKELNGCVVKSGS